MVVTQHYKCTKCYWIVHFIMTNTMLCESHLNFNRVMKNKRYSGGNLTRSSFLIICSCPYSRLSSVIYLKLLQCCPMCAWIFWTTPVDLIGFICSTFRKFSLIFNCKFSSIRHMHNIIPSENPHKSGNRK